MWRVGTCHSSAQSGACLGAKKHGGSVLPPSTLLLTRRLERIGPAKAASTARRCQALLVRAEAAIIGRGIVKDAPRALRICIGCAREKQKCTSTDQFFMIVSPSTDSPLRQLDRRTY